ncbi:MAG: leucyl/phenylalanyl-tRNA--protein transferase [Phycisphaerae bacterium]|nr:leucyl/phenylalanyl-tRNA--protein transferase [Phycisphaerae bacterium]
MQELSADLLLNAYLNGFFPMADPDSGELEWYCPDPRAILELTDLHISKTLLRTVRSARFEIRTNTCFDTVLLECAKPAAGRESTWIDQRITEAYGALHRSGFAHSVEAWKDDNLVGGLYGVQIGGAFFGESMFRRQDASGRDASKVCLVWLTEHLQTIGATLLDIQFMTPHLRRFGACEIPADDYLARLATAVELPCDWQ